jgi:Tol biopolymer transport system component
LEDLGEIRNALLVDETIFLIREFGIQKLNLKNSSSKILLRFEDSLMSGQLILDAGHSRLFYGAITYYTNVSMIGFYDLKKDTINSILTYSEPMVTLFILGATEDGQSLLLLPGGQDPSISDLYLVNIKDGAISKQLFVSGYGYTDLAPDSSILVNMAHVFSASDEIENRIYTYDLFSIPMPSPKEYRLPNPAFEIFGNGFFWSPDGKRIYFALVEIKNDPYIFISRGLWVLDMESGSIEMITNTPDQPLHTSGVSPDEKLILLRPETNGDAYLVNTQTGEIRSFSVPVMASFVGWK